ncbi:MAG TPA: recombination protein RecR [Desulfotomaculum sp.]|nr:MAG: Recombination protein RecR [Desulfotomaculum sp. 46_296]HAG11177.1 recombination protein RecR [Desulfotomaculum sp.]HBY03139.1 recombination protein RecR [Desulfotomaculum sp.]
MKYYGASITRLIDELAGLPGVGPKSAQRMALYLLNAPAQVTQNLASAMLEARKNIRYCSVCSNLTDTQLCQICSDQRRNRDILCIVEEPKDVSAIEKVRGFKGMYHVLHGAISPRDNIGPDELTVKQLLNRLQEGTIKEVILATNPNLEGEATSLFLSQIIKPMGIKVTRLAYGLPMGASVEYADEVTLTRALEGRREIE